MFRLPDRHEAVTTAVSIVQEAIDRNRKIRISYVRYLSLTDDEGRKRRRWFPDEEHPEIGTALRFGKRPVLSVRPSHRLYEPVAVAMTVRRHPVLWSTAWDYAPYADVIKWSPNGYIAGRVRLDHVIVRGGVLALSVSRLPCTVRGTGLDPTVKRGEDPLNPLRARV